MHTRALGATDLQASAIGLGCMGMSQSYGEADPVESEATLRRALDVGVTFWDTANVYGAGHNESFIAKVLATERDRVVLATKFGIIPGGLDGDPAHVAGNCDASLGRLGVDVIDLYYLHRVDPEFPIEETVGAMAQLVTAGKVKALGLSEVSSDTLRRAHGVHPITAVQSEYSLWTRDVEKLLLATCRELNVTFVPFSPLGRGFFTGVITEAEFGSGDMRANFPRFQGENFDANKVLLAGLTAIADRLGATPGQLSLAWLLAKGDNIVPIPGTKRVSRIEENAAAADVALSSADIAELDKLFDPANVAGARYPENMFRFIQRD